MNKAYLLTGGNMGNRKWHLQQALEHIKHNIGPVVAASGIYETAAWGKTDQAAFLNQALEIDTPLTAQELLNALLSIETQMGRLRQEKFGARIIDIDILLYNNSILHEAALTVPHPELTNRRFALTPLMEIAKDVIHPVSGKTIYSLLKECPDVLPVKKLDN
jgi:2-amino-4-hydroxy-6-hydroxymethyldihydropteridine diphosphokinase